MSTNTAKRLNKKSLKEDLNNKMRYSTEASLYSWCTGGTDACRALKTSQTVTRSQTRQNVLMVVAWHVGETTVRTAMSETTLQVYVSTARRDITVQDSISTKLSNKPLEVFNEMSGRFTLISEWQQNREIFAETQGHYAAKNWLFLTRCWCNFSAMFVASVPVLTGQNVIFS